MSSSAHAESLPVLIDFLFLFLFTKENWNGERFMLY